MTESLFNAFESVSAKEWKQKIQVDLKGADYNKSLIWTTNEGIDVKPFYHADMFDTLPTPSNTTATEFKICQSIFVADAEKSNQHALDALEKGAESLQFTIAENGIAIDTLLKDIDVSTVPIYFDLKFLDLEFIKQLNSYTSSNFNLNIDIIGNLAKSGNWFKDLKEDHLTLETIIKNSENFRSTLSVDVALYQNAGANITQQLAYALAHANEYLNHYGTAINKPMTFNVAVGTNYFFEIAKLRALRRLWQTLASEYNIDTDCYIFAMPTKRNKTLYDYNVNMLRTTTECMSAILGGANAISNLPYDAIYHKTNEFGNRIARNQLLVLKHESYFDKVDNPADGAYYIETITQQLAENALAIFKDIEANGGFLHQLKDNTIQRKIKESAQKEQQQFDSTEEILLGSNKHPNPQDRMKAELELYPFVKINKRKTLIEPIIEKRLAETLEQNRLKEENK